GDRAADDRARTEGGQRIPPAVRVPAIAATLVAIAAMAIVPATTLATPLHLLHIARLRSADLRHRHGEGRCGYECRGEHGDGHGGGNTALDRCLHVDLPWIVTVLQ